MPYDRVAPNAETIAQRIATLAALAGRAREANQAARRADHRQRRCCSACRRATSSPASSLKLQPGNVMTMQALIERLEISGYVRAGTVTDPGQYAVRGGILDLYPPGGEPVRLDFFGDTLESIRAFDPETQRTAARLESRAAPAHERDGADARGAAAPSASAMSRCSARSPATTRSTSSISAGRQHQGMEHWLPLFHDGLATLFDYLPGAARHARPAGRRCARTGGSSRSPTITMRARRRSSARPSARRLIIPCRPRACS